jgi:trans-L-3-hydroxyproline dehydratase
VTVDVGFGGAYYAVLPAAALGLSLAPGHTSPVAALADAGAAVTAAVHAAVPLTHPAEPALAFLYGTILTDGTDGDTVRAWLPHAPPRVRPHDVADTSGGWPA